MNYRTYLTLLLATFLMLPALALAQQKAGLKVGAKVQNFTLDDQSGTKREFKQLLKSGPVAIVFYRSADW